MLCNSCNREQSAKDEDAYRKYFIISSHYDIHHTQLHVTSRCTVLDLPLRFSEKSGFGIIPRPPQLCPDNLLEGTPQYNHYHDHITLQRLMSNATNAEEAAIRPIAPAFSIINLTGGNIASRGNTSCLLQESRLGLILPNLPENCRVVIVKRRDTSSRMRSTKYKQYNIETMLRLLRRTGHPAWANIEVSDQNV